MKKNKFTFICPNDGFVEKDFISFLCNKCGPQEMILLNGMYVCPECLEKEAKFQCRLCGSEEVAMKLFIESKSVFV